MSSRFTQYILIAMALGIVMGTIVFNYMPDSRVEIAADVNLIAMLFLRLIKMIIAPLVFATLVGGIAHMGSGSKLGRIFAKIRPSLAPEPIWAMPPTSVANTRGAMIILIRRRNSIAIRFTLDAISTRLSGI